MTFDVFDGPPPKENDETADVGDNEDEEAKTQEEKEQPEKLPYHILVPEVVREPRIHYYKVPRLGSYMAVILEYDSCLFEEAFDEGVKDMVSVNTRRQQMEDDKAEWEKEE